MFKEGKLNNATIAIGNFHPSKNTKIALFIAGKFDYNEFQVESMFGNALNLKQINCKLVLDIHFL